MCEQKVSGRSACGGSASGTPKVITAIEDLDSVHDGDILVAKETDIAYVPAMLKAGAIITETGGRFCHAAIWARENNKPTILQIKDATILFNGISEIHVDATAGEVRWAANQKT